MESTSHKDYVVTCRSPKCIEKEDERHGDPIESSMPRSPSQIYQTTAKMIGSVCVNREMVIFGFMRKNVLAVMLYLKHRLGRLKKLI